MLNNHLKLFVLSLPLLVYAFAAAPARAEPVILSCQNNAGGTWTYRINYATGLIEELNSSGVAWTNRIATASVSPNAIVWSIDQPSSYMSGDDVVHQTTEHWEGNIDRLSGTGWFQSYYEDLYHHNPVSFTCQLGTPKF